LKQKLLRELKAVTVAALYFGCWIGGLVLLKHLVLTEYKIAFHGWSVILMGALILSKVVLVLEHVSFGAWLRARPAWVDVLLRTALYSVGLVLVMVLERGLEGRHEHGGFVGAVTAAFDSTDKYHIYANSICLSAALLVYNVLSVLRRHLGERGLLKLFLVPLPADPEHSQPPIKPE
jgi:hypothetical protein